MHSYAWVSVDQIRLSFAYTPSMKVGGQTRQIDLERLGPSLVIAASLVLAVRTAKWTVLDGRYSNADWTKEIENSVQIAHMILSQAIRKYPGLFQHKNVPWYVPTDEDVQE